MAFGRGYVEARKTRRQTKTNIQTRGVRYCLSGKGGFLGFCPGSSIHHVVYGPSTFCGLSNHMPPQPSLSPLRLAIYEEEQQT